MKVRSFLKMKSLALLPLGFLLLTSSGLAQTPQATPPPPAAPRSVQFPKPVEKILPNGLRVIVVQRSQMPLVTAQVLIKSGGEVDPSDLAGTADMTASLLTRGTTTRSATQIAEAIEALGGSIASGGGWDASTITTSVMSSRIDPAFAILADVVRNPAFKDEEIERLRRQALNNLRVALGTPGSIARFVAALSIAGLPTAGRAKRQRQRRPARRCRPLLFNRDSRRRKEARGCRSVSAGGDQETPGCAGFGGRA